MADYNVKEIAYGGNNYKMYPANLTSETHLNNAAQDATETQDRVYPVRMDANGKLAVNVPWTDSGGTDMTGATETTAGTHGLVPAPAAGDNTKYLRGDGTWETPSSGAEWKYKELTSPIGTNTTNSRQSATVSELSGAKEIIIVVRTGATGMAYQTHFVYFENTTYTDYMNVRPPDSNNQYIYDVQWIPSSNEINIRYDYKGTSVSSNAYPKIYGVLYR